MVINSTNINKMNNHISAWLNSLYTKKTMTYDIRNPGPVFEQAQKCGRFKLLLSHVFFLQKWQLHHRRGMCS